MNPNVKRVKDYDIYSVEIHYLSRLNRIIKRIGIVNFNTRLTIMRITKNNVRSALLSTFNGRKRTG